MFRARSTTTTSTHHPLGGFTSTTYEDASTSTQFPYKEKEEEEEGFTSTTYEDASTTPHEEGFPTQENITSFPDDHIQNYGLVEKHDIEVIDIWKYFFTLEQKWFVVN